MNKVRFGIIGCGGIAYRRTMPAMRECKHAAIRAVMDTNAAAVEKAKAEFQVPFGTTRLEEILARDDVDAVYVATPAYLHKEQVLAAAKARKHVLCEKPLAIGVGDVKIIIAACQRSKMFLAEGFMMKFHSLHRKARQMIAAGRLGKIVLARAQLSCWYPEIPGAWRQVPEQSGGGALIDMATHLYDLIMFLTGLDVASVAAICNNLNFKYPVEDSSSTLLKLSNGAHAFVDAFFCIPDEAVEPLLEIYGTRGSIRAVNTIGQGAGGDMTAYLTSADKAYDARQARGETGRIKVEAAPVNTYAAEIDAFALAILSGKPPELNGPQNALKIARLTDAAYKAAKTKRWIAINGK